MRLKDYEALITQKNELVENGNGIFTRYKHPAVDSCPYPYLLALRFG